MSELKLRRVKSSPQFQKQYPIQGAGSGGVIGANRYINQLRARDLGVKPMMGGIKGGIAGGLLQYLRNKTGRQPTAENLLASMAMPVAGAFIGAGRTLRDPYREDVQDYLDWSYGADDRYSPVYKREGLLGQPRVRSLKPKYNPVEWEHETY